MSSFAYGFSPALLGRLTVQDLTGFAFQLGVMCLVVLQLRTAATGLGRGARIMLQVERVLLSLAMIWSLLHGLVPSIRDAVWLAVLDVFWPLSMLGMFVIASRSRAAGRWRGLARWWPLVAESWAVVTVPTIGIGGATVEQHVGAFAPASSADVALGLLLMARTAPGGGARLTATRRSSEQARRRGTGPGGVSAPRPLSAGARQEVRSRSSVTWRETDGSRPSPSAR